MRLLILTTATSHHRHYVRELARDYPELHVIVESTSVQPSFETAHSFELERDRFERELWFDGQDVQFSTIASLSTFQNINDEAAVRLVSKLRPVITIDFGTRKLLPPMIFAAGENILNLHGGDPQQYRGLDSHLWAIYHEDFGNLITTLHVLNDKLDDGSIVRMRPIALERGLKLSQLRASNTECAIELTKDALREFEEFGSLTKHPQTQAGRYYSFMPTSLKATCVEKFSRFTSGLR